MTEDQKVNILMVDDQPGKLLTYEVILGDLGENLLKATSANEALTQLLRNDIGVVLMDVSMPGIGGFELADMIRQHPRFSKTAIIFISGVHFSDSDKINGYRRGAVDYISVPVVPEVLRAKVGVFVELYRKTRMLEYLNAELERRVEERAEALRQTESQLRERADLLELASEAIIVHDLEGKLEYWNSGAEDLYGWKREEVLGCNVHELLATVFPIAYEDITAALLQMRAWEGNLIHRTKFGTEVVVASRMAFNRTRDAVLEINRDITARLKAEQALREAEKFAAMGRVAGIIAHEINNPLEAIVNLFFLLRHHPSLDDQARHYAQMAEQELARVSHITRQTLSFYRESKHPISVPICEVLENILELQSNQLRTTGITVERRYQYDAVIDGYPVELRQVFFNLIANAIQAISRNGKLRIAVRRAIDARTKRHGVRVSVIDTGHGVAPHDARQLFTPFFTTKSEKGTGLGLWISKGIVQKYEGSIRFRSIRSDGGAVTCFSIFLPTTKSDASQRASIEPESATAKKEAA